MKITKYQYSVLEIVNDEGKIFLFEDGSVGLDDGDGNNLKFRGSTFDSLIKKKLIKVVSRPNLGTEIYGLTEVGKNSL